MVKVFLNWSVVIGLIDGSVPQMWHKMDRRESEDGSPCTDLRSLSHYTFLEQSNARGKIGSLGSIKSRLKSSIMTAQHQSDNASWQDLNFNTFLWKAPHLYLYLYLVHFTPVTHIIIHHKINGFGQSLHYTLTSPHMHTIHWNKLHSGVQFTLAEGKMILYGTRD